MPAGQRAGPWDEGSAPIQASLRLPLARVNGAAGRAVLMLPVDAPKRNRKQWFDTVHEKRGRPRPASLSFRASRPEMFGPTIIRVTLPVLPKRPAPATNCLSLNEPALAGLLKNRPVVHGRAPAT